MVRLSRTLLVILVAALAVVFAACGGDDGVSADTDVNELLERTFSGDKQVDSGRLDLKLEIDVRGGEDAQVQGPISLSVAGPFQSQGDGKLPLFDVDATFEGAGQSLSAGLTSTGDKGFVNFQGTEYEVSQQVFQQFRASFEQAQKEAGNQQNRQSLATLGIDPRRWLTNARNAGEAKVGDTDTIKITGGVDVVKLLDDVNTALEKARSLGVEGSDTLPERLTDEQKQRAADAIDNLAVEIYTGKEDTILRRMLVRMDVRPPEGSSSGVESGSLSLDFSLLELNEEQEISAPEDARPFDQLLSQLGDLGLGGAAGGSGGAGSGSGSGSGAGASAEDLREYSKCIEDAGNDVAKAQKCAELLTP